MTKSSTSTAIAATPPVAAAGSPHLSGIDGLRAVAAPWQGVHAAFVLVGSVFTLALLVWSWQQDRSMFGFVSLIAIGLLTNAFTTGALSGPTDRYQARIAWLVLLPPMLWSAQRSSRR